MQRMKVLVLRSSLMGILIGIIPGVGATVSTFLAYSTARDSSPTPEKFGHGAPEGVVLDGFEAIGQLDAAERGAVVEGLRADRLERGREADARIAA